MIRDPVKCFSARHPGRGLAPYPGSQHALAFVTIPDNAFRHFRDDPAERTNHPDMI